MRLSVQLYSLRNLGPLDKQLQLVRESGLRFVEACGANYEDMEGFRGLLDVTGLSCPSGHIGVDRLRRDVGSVIAMARVLGIEELNVWGLPEGEHWTDAAGWQKAGGELAVFAHRLADAGLGFGFHNHDWELAVMEDGRSALEHLFEGAAGSPLRWQPDPAWLARGATALEKLLAACPLATSSVHVKDMAPSTSAGDKEEGWADLGHGILPWKQWLPPLIGRGARLLVLEHDAPDDPARFLRRSVSAINELLSSLNVQREAGFA